MVVGSGPVPGRDPRFIDASAPHDVGVGKADRGSEQHVALGILGNAEVGCHTLVVRSSHG